MILCRSPVSKCPIMTGHVSAYVGHYECMTLEANYAPVVVLTCSLRPEKGNFSHKRKRKVSIFAFVSHFEKSKSLKDRQKQIEQPTLVGVCTCVCVRACVYMRVHRRNPVALLAQLCSDLFTNCLINRAPSSSQAPSDRSDCPLIVAHVQQF